MQSSYFKFPALNASTCLLEIYQTKSEKRATRACPGVAVLIKAGIWDALTMKIISVFTPRRKGDNSGKIDSFSQFYLYKKTEYANIIL